MDQKQEDFYKRLKTELEKSTDLWPLDYLYKFIVPNNEKKIQQIEVAFADTKFTTKQSGKGNFVSVSIRVMMPNADSIIQKYKQVSSIEGIISL